MDIALLKRGDLSKLTESLFFRGTDIEFVKSAVRDERCFIKEFAKAETIFSYDTYEHSIGFILSGEIDVNRETGGRMLNLNTIGSESYFGVAAVFSDQTEYVTILTAARPCRIIFLEQGLLQELMRRNFTLCDNYIRFLTDRIHFLNIKIRSLSADTADRALASFLLAQLAGEDRLTAGRRTQEKCRDMSEAGGDLQETDEGMWISEQNVLQYNKRSIGSEKHPDGCVTIHGSLSELAERLNIGRASLYRAFDSLESKGIIKKAGKQVEILDRSSLNKI